MKIVEFMGNMNEKKPFDKFIKHWNNFIEAWKKAPYDVVKNDVYFSKYGENREKSPLYQGTINNQTFDFYKYCPEPYLGNPENCCAVILNLNPGFGVSGEEKSHPDYKLQHWDYVKSNSTRYSERALKFDPYLSGEYINSGRKNITKKSKNIPGGVFWWYGYYNNSWHEGRVGYVNGLYKTWFGQQPDKLPFALEICPWHSHNFNLSHIFLSQARRKTEQNDLIQAIKRYVLEPALEATAGTNVLPFVICIGQAITELSELLGLDEVKECRWNEKEHDGCDWPSNNNRSIRRTYQLYRYNCNGKWRYLLNTYAPGSNRPPRKDAFQNKVEPHIIDKIKNYIKKESASR